MPPCCEGQLKGCYGLIATFSPKRKTRRWYKGPFYMVLSLLPAVSIYAEVLHDGGTVMQIMVCLGPFEAVFGWAS